MAWKNYTEVQQLDNLRIRQSECLESWCLRKGLDNPEQFTVV